MTTISTPSQLKRYKNTLMFFSIVSIVLGVITIGKAVVDKEYMLFFNIQLLFILPINFYREMKLIHSIAFDTTTLYFTSENKPMAKIGLDQIRSITIGRFDGIHRINLIKSADPVKRIYFKTSLGYPFNFSKKDKVIYALRDAIEAYKKLLDDDYEDEVQITRVANGMAR